MGDLKVSGLASGLDIEGIISSLMKIEQQPITNMENQKKILGFKKTLWNQINSSFLALRTSLDPLLKAATMGAKTTTTSNDKLLTADATNKASTGTYNVTVESLATYTKYTGGNGIGSVTDPAMTFDNTAASSKLVNVPTAGYFTINGTQITVNKTDSINTVLAAINSSAAGVNATYDAPSDKIILVASTPGGPIDLGSGGDTSNFLTAMGLLATVQVGDTKTSQFHLGGVNPYQTLEKTNFSTAVTNGSFKINGVEITYDVTKDAINDIINRINTSTAGVTASYDQTQDRMLLTAKNTGSLGISLETVSGNFLDAVKLSTATGGIQALGTNSQFIIDGFNNNQPINSTFNDVSDVLAGVTLHLKAIDLVNPVTLQVNYDNKPAENAINAFVDKFNATMDLLNDKLGEKKVKDAKTDLDLMQGLLSGDYNLSQSKMNLGTKIMDPIAGLPTSLNMLSQIGIELKLVDGPNSGKVEHLQVVDSTKLENALKDNADAVFKLFFNDVNNNGVADRNPSGTPEDGIAARLSYMLDDLTSTSTQLFGTKSYKMGTIPRLLDGFDSEIKDLNEQEDALNTRLTQRETTLRNQFTAMEQALQNLYDQSSWLSQQLGQKSQ